jgi:aminoglycoside phosphotransferase (APT) family kinase protein
MVDRNAEMASALGAFFDARAGAAGHEVHDLVRLSGGASRETFGFTLVAPPAADGEGERSELVLQRARVGSLSATFSMEGEAELLGAAAAAGVPVAPVVAATDDPAVLDAPFIVMRRVAGETIARRILRDDEYAAARPVVVAQAARALAGIHALPISAGPHLRAEDPVAQLRSLYDALHEAHPAFELAFRWLDEHRGALGPGGVAPPQTIVHGDFRLGNLIIGPEGLEAVLDWELAHLGDPLEDLGWFCVRAWRFGSPLPVAGLGAYDELIDVYAEATGRAVTHDQVRWWEVLGTLRWGIICILQASGHLSGASRSVELAAIGRRVCETELDLLLLIDPDGVTPPPVDDADGYDAGSHGAPTAPQLIEAVREFLENDVMGATTGRVQFHARVAANVLAMVERELASGAAMAAAHRARLDALGYADDAALAEAIRTGAETRLPEVTAAVRASVHDKLAVANPTYGDS